MAIVKETLTHNQRIARLEAGAVIIPPGQMVVVAAITTAISVIASLMWEEIPL